MRYIIPKGKGDVQKDTFKKSEGVVACFSIVSALWPLVFKDQRLVVLNKELGDIRKIQLSLGVDFFLFDRVIGKLRGPDGKDNQPVVRHFVRLVPN